MSELSNSHEKISPPSMQVSGLRSNEAEVSDPNLKRGKDLAGKYGILAMLDQLFEPNYLLEE